MICVNCNTPVPDHSKFCLACGSLVSNPDIQSAATRTIDESATIQMENLLRQDTEGEFTIGELIGKGGMAAVSLPPPGYIPSGYSVRGSFRWIPRSRCGRANAA